MNDSYHVRGLYVVQLHHVIGVILARDLIRRGAVHKRCTLSMEAHILMPELEDHRLIAAERERDEAHGLVGIFRLAHVRKTRAVLHCALRQHDEVAASLEPRLVLCVIGAAEHHRPHYAAREGFLSYDGH